MVQMSTKKNDSIHCYSASGGFFDRLVNRGRVYYRKAQCFKNTPDITALRDDISHIIRTSLSDGTCSGSITSINYLTKIPLKFTHQSLERLYVLNINELMQSRVLILGLSMLVLTLFIWPLSIITFKNTDAWADDYFVIIFLHISMSVTVFLYMLLTITTMSNLYHLCELFSLVTFGCIITIWGIWHLIAGIFLRDEFDNSLIKGVSASNEAMYAFNFIYGILPIVALDTILPTRIIYTWWIHLSFIILYSSSVISYCIVNLSYVPIAYTYTKL